MGDCDHTGLYIIGIILLTQTCGTDGKFKKVQKQNTNIADSISETKNKLEDKIDSIKYDMPSKDSIHNAQPAQITCQDISAAIQEQKKPQIYTENVTGNNTPDKFYMKIGRAHV